MEDLHACIAAGNIMRNKIDKEIPEPGMPVISHVIIKRRQGITVPSDEEMLRLIQP
jgi:hypothetical protein